MPKPQTEMRNALGAGLDLLPGNEALTILARAQVAAAEAVEAAVPQIAQGAQLMARTISAGGRLIYMAAGSSALMAMADALEMPGTYGIAREQIAILPAGGMSELQVLLGGPEDDADEARTSLAGIAVKAGDCVIALTASGSTPYAIAAAQAARAAGASTIGLANNAGAALFDTVDVAICLATPPEVVAGSTRMGAGTAQKIALNMLSTMMAMELGHVHDGFMVNVVADNIKLRERAKRIVMAVSGVDAATAAQAIEDANGAVKLAIVLAAGARGAEAGEALLTQHGGMLRPALAELRGEMDGK